MQINHIYWIAGFLDGEGCFGYYNRTPIILVGSTDKDLMELYVKYTKVINKLMVVKSRDGVRKVAYRIAITGSLAVQWMMTLYPLMCQRRKNKIKSVISSWKALGLKNEDKLYCNSGHALSGSNLYIKPPSGTRGCKKCRLEAQRKYYAGNPVRNR